MTERIRPYNGVYYLRPKPLSTERDRCPYVVESAMPPRGAQVILFRTVSKRSTARHAILSAVRHIAGECASTKSLDQLAQEIKSWPLEKRREMRRRVKAKLDRGSAINDKEHK